MAAGNFLSCLNITLGIEKGFVIDNGGPTNLGITQTTLSTYLGRPATLDEVKALTYVQVQPIYQTLFWNEIRGDQLYQGLDLCLFDAAVNSGVSQAVKWLQRALGVEDDGVMGPTTVTAAQQANAYDICLDVCQQRARMMLSLNNPIEETNERGWMARVLKILQLGTLMVHENAATSLPKPLGLPSA